MRRHVVALSWHLTDAWLWLVVLAERRSSGSHSKKDRLFTGVAGIARAK